MKNKFKGKYINHFHDLTSKISLQTLIESRLTAGHGGGWVRRY